MATKLFRYEGPEAFVVALQMTVNTGDELYGPDALALNDGFTEIKESDAKKSKVINDKDEAKEAVVGGSGEQTEADH